MAAKEVREVLDIHNMSMIHTYRSESNFGIPLPVRIIMHHTNIITTQEYTHTHTHDDALYRMYVQN